jgi:hypothetical protein
MGDHMENQTPGQAIDELLECEGPLLVKVTLACAAMFTGAVVSEIDRLVSAISNKARPPEVSK